MRAIHFLGICVVATRASFHDWVCKENSAADRTLSEIRSIILSNDDIVSIESQLASIKSIVLAAQSSIEYGSTESAFLEDASIFTLAQSASHVMTNLESTYIPGRRHLATLSGKIEQELVATSSMSASSSPCSGTDEESSDEYLLFNIFMALFLTLCASLASGLTMGLVSIEPLEMAIKLRSGNEDEMLQAQRILPLVTRHHFLLVSLLLFNSLAFEALPLFLDNIFSPVVAVIISVTLILFVGEILPSAIFTGPNQLRIAATLSPLVWIMMFAFAPISWPVGKLLDFILGVEEYKRYNRAEISALVEVQHDLFNKEKDILGLEGGVEIDEENPLHEDEVSIVLGVLGVGQKHVSDAMIAYDKVYCLNIDQTLDADCMASIVASGYSRIPVFEGEDRRNIRGYLQVKKLIVLNPDDARCIRSLVLRAPEIVSPHLSLLELLNLFQLGRAHIALVSENPDGTREALKEDNVLEGDLLPIGIICLEDILEEIIQEEILDESDHLAIHAESKARATLAKYTRKRQKQRKLMATAAGLHALGRTGLSKKSPIATVNITEKSPLQPKK